MNTLLSEFELKKDKMKKTLDEYRETTTKEEELLSKAFHNMGKIIYGVMMNNKHNPNLFFNGELFGIDNETGSIAEEIRKYSQSSKQQ